MPLRFADHSQATYEYPLTIRHLLDSAMMTAGDQEIVYRDRIRFTYREFGLRVGRLASLLRAHGAGEGVTVAVMDWDSHRYLEAYFAIPMMGAVLLTVNVRLPPTQLVHTLIHADAKVLLVHRDFFPLLDVLLPQLTGIKTLIAILDDGEITALPTACVGDYEALLAQAAPDFMFHDFDENAVATTFYTTGTTGLPKGVCSTHRQLVLHTLTACGPFGSSMHDQGLGIDDVYMPLTPMFHAHAWGVPYIATMLGVKQVYPGRYEPDFIIDLRAAEGMSYSHCVPAILQMVLAAADRKKADLTGWKMTIGGSALTPALFDEARRHGMGIGAGYGMSETAPTITLARPRADLDPGAPEQAAAMTGAGVPLPLVSVRVVDEAMRDVPSDGTSRGEVVLRAPWLTTCYTGDTAGSAELWRGGWLHTQDIGTLDGHGYLTICDRLKDVIKTGGEWLTSLSIEDVIQSVAGVAAAAVIAVPDRRWGERPMGVVVAAAGAQPTLAELNAAISLAIERGGLSCYAKLERVEIVDALPLTSVGKIDKKLLRARYATQPDTT